MPKKDDAEAEALALLNAAIDQGDARRSALYQWMWSHYDWFSAKLEGTNPNWQLIAEAFAKMGFSENGEPYRSERVRQTWWRVRRRKGGIKSSTRTETAGPAPEPVSPVAEAPSERTTRISPISPVSPVSPVTPARPTEDAKPSAERQSTKSGDPDEVRRKLDAQLNQRKGSMPDPIK